MSIDLVVALDSSREASGILISSIARIHCTFQTVRLTTKSCQFASLICSGFAAAQVMRIYFRDIACDRFVARIAHERRFVRGPARGQAARRRYLGAGVLGVREVILRRSRGWRPPGRER